MPETNVPKWLNLDEIGSPETVNDLAKVRAEADELAPTVRAFAIRAFQATQTWSAATNQSMLPDEVRLLADQHSGAQAAFDAIERMIADLQVAYLEKPDSLEWPDWFEQEASKLPPTGFTKGPTQ